MIEKKAYQILSILGILFMTGMVYAQQQAPCDSSDQKEYDRVEINGEILKTQIEDGDTVLLANLANVTVTSPRSFDSYEEYMRYKRYKKYAAKVYPYAVDAIKIFRQTEYLTRFMDNRHKRRHIKALQDRLEDEFKEPLKDLTKTQGKILVNMIEKELDTPMHDLIKGMRGGLTATFWSTTGFFFGYHLKRGYEKGKDPIMDAVLEDLNIDVGEPPYEELR